jgi:hypothetical protein
MDDQSKAAYNYRLSRGRRTMAAKKFRPSFFRHFKKIGVVHSLLSL